ncbi:hypothetical protein ACVIGA_000305 [Bradyrhizobium sp. USDA 3240]
MQINVIYDPSVASAPSGFKTAVAYVVNLLDTAFTNNVSLNIHVGWGEVGGLAISSGFLGESEEAKAPAYDYTTIRDALIADGTSSAQLAAFATLPTSDPTVGETFDIGRAEAKALGLIGANDPANDGWVGFDATANWSYGPTATPGSNQYYLVGSIEHEITEVLGRDSLLGVNGEHYANGWGVPDLFRFSAPGVRELAPGAVHSTGYFSIDNGVTSLASWNNHVAKGDLGDWDSGFGSGGGPGPFGDDAFNNESNSGVINGFTQTDFIQMQTLGWRRRTISCSTARSISSRRAIPPATSSCRPAARSTSRVPQPPLRLMAAMPRLTTAVRSTASSSMPAARSPSIPEARPTT